MQQFPDNSVKYLTSNIKSINDTPLSFLFQPFKYLGQDFLQGGKVLTSCKGVGSRLLARRIWSHSTRLVSLYPLDIHCPCPCPLLQLSYSTAWQNLKDTFRAAGSVQHVDILTGPDGRSKGSAVVWFDTCEGARKAIGEII